MAEEKKERRIKKIEVTPEREASFWSRVIKSDGCWKWIGTKNNHGYGSFSKQISAHRFSVTLANGPIPEGLWVLHKCDNPECVNPDHLFLGTCKDNSDDKIRKGRYRNGHDDRTHCIHGHEFTPENTWIGKANKRCCKECQARRHAERRARIKKQRGTIANKDKTHCLRGHELSPDNIYLNKDNNRSCKTCKKAKDKVRRERNKLNLIKSRESKNICIAYQPNILNQWQPKINTISI